MDKREFIRKSIAGAVAIGTSGVVSTTFADTTAKPKKTGTIKESWEKPDSKFIR